MAHRIDRLTKTRREWKSFRPFIVALFFIACGGPQSEVQQSNVDTTPDTTLGPDDLFDVRVYGEQELSNTFRVASDGTVDYPLLGRVQVDGLTPSQVVKTIETGLKEGGFLKNPHVSILVKEYKSKKISVFGQVKKPGTFPYQDGMSVVEAISLAGGFTSMARKNDTTVIRTVAGVKKRFRVPVEEIGQGKAPNFVLNTGDIVFIPERIF